LLAQPQRSQAASLKMESIYLCVFDSPVAAIVRRAVILIVGMQDANWDRNTVEIEFLEWMPKSKKETGHHRC
jgi:hypothetical protein